MRYQNITPTIRMLPNAWGLGAPRSPHLGHTTLEPAGNQRSVMQARRLGEKHNHESTRTFEGSLFLFEEDLQCVWNCILLLQAAWHNTLVHWCGCQDEGMRETKPHCSVVWHLERSLTHDYCIYGDTGDQEDRKGTDSVDRQAPAPRNIHISCETSTFSQDMVRRSSPWRDKYFLWLMTDDQSHSAAF